MKSTYYKRINNELNFITFLKLWANYNEFKINLIWANFQTEFWKSPAFIKLWFIQRIQHCPVKL